eukprot:1049242-Pyramimonas_sp.AAC.1
MGLISKVLRSRPPDEDPVLWEKWCPTFADVLYMSADELDGYGSEAAHSASLLEQAVTRARGMARRKQ